jgi:hypothetical protein
MPVTADPLRTAPPAIIVDSEVDAWSTALTSKPEEDGSISVLLVVKAGFSIDDGELRPLDKAEPVVAADSWEGEPGLSNLSAAGEVATPSERRQCYVLGEVPTPVHGSAPVDIGLRFDLNSGRHERMVTITPPGHWKSSLGFRRPEFEPWSGEPLAIDWTLAYGGVCPVTGLYHPENPAGCGFRTRGRPEEREAVPRFHPAGQVWSRPGKETQAAGLGPMPVRREGDSLRAPAEQCFDGEWQAGETLELIGLTGNQSRWVEALELPSFRPRPVLMQGRHGQPLAGRVDTLVVDSAAGTLSLLWRCAFSFRPVADPIRVVIVE